MTQRAIIAACVLWLAAVGPWPAWGAAHDGAPQPRPAEADPYLHRPNLVVADMDRALRIYRDILGFKVNVVMPVKEVDFMRAVFNAPPGVTMRIAFLSSEKQRFGQLGMTEIKGVELPAPPAGTYPDVLIIEHQRDVEGLYQQLKDEGCELTRIFDLNGPKRREFIFTDHDGHRVLMMKLQSAAD